MLRPKSKDRHQYFDVARLNDDSVDKLINACESLNMLNEILPKKKHYYYIVVFGSSTGGMKMSRDFVYQKLGKIFEKNPNIKVYVVTGNRNLDKAIDSQEIIDKLSASGFPCTALYAAKEKWHYDSKVHNKNFKSNIEGLFVNVEENEIPKDGRGVNRANTPDTVKKTFRNKKIKTWIMLCVSVNPFIWYQHNVCQNVLCSY